MTSPIMEKVAVSVIAAVTLAALTLFWNWASQGGVVKALGGVTRAELAMGTEVIPAPGGNGKSKTCPDGSFMVGALWQVDGGGPHGIMSWVSPVCRMIGK